MKPSEIYGVNRGSVPDDLQTAASTENSGVSFLSFDESRQFESASLNLFHAESAGGLDWSSTSDTESHFYEDEAEAVTLVRQIVVDRIGRESAVVLFWGSLDLPSMLLPASTLIAHVASVVEVGPVFWVFAPERRVLLECHPTGRITVAVTPPI